MERNKREEMGADRARAGERERASEREGEEVKAMNIHV